MRIRISLPEQTLVLRDAAGGLLQRYSISSAARGPGETYGSFCTPRGRHIIRAKVGAGETANTVFVRRRPTGELWTPQLAADHPRRDWILTRILWLSGTQVGFNRLGNVDTMRRYVYLHGSPDTVEMGRPGSIGCIRMKNADIIELFAAVPVRTPVAIDDFSVTVDDWPTQQSAAKPVRYTVIVGEQGLPVEIEQDHFDALSRHAIARDADGHPIGVGRLLPDGHIGRMAVYANWRGQGVGRAVLDALIDEARTLDYPALRLNAQTQAIGFYQRFGFEEIGERFIDAGLPHQRMQLNLRR